MRSKTSSVVYLTPSNEAERNILHEILAPHSWAAGEFGLMLTDAAFKECVESLSARTEKSVKAFLRKTLVAARKADAGDVCLNFGITG
jgi:hypothetical protein